MKNAGVMGRSLILGWLLAAHPASAQVSATDRTLAQSLFEEAKKLMQASRYAEACPKLEESQRLDPGGGTMLNLALCYESAGKLSTAWADFKEALSLAHRDGRPEREQAAQEHIAALEGKLPHLTITVDAPTADEELSLDGSPIGKAAWGSAMSIDPGTHEVAASAPGKNRWALSVSVAVAEHKAVAVPALGGQAPAAAPPVGVLPAPAAPPPVGYAVAPPSASPPPPSSPHSGKKTAGWILAGGGVVLAGVGGFFGVQAFGKRHDSNAECPTDHSCTPKGVSLNDDAKTDAWIADVGVGLGLVAVGVGTYLLLSSGSSGEKPPTTVTASRGLSVDAKTLPSGGAVTVGGVW